MSATVKAGKLLAVIGPVGAGKVSTGICLSAFLEHPTFQNVSATEKVGKLLAVIGPVGAGKVSTCFCLSACLEQPTLQNVSASAKAGKLLAVIGPFGAGKVSIMSIYPDVHPSVCVSEAANLTECVINCKGWKTAGCGWSCRSWEG